MDARACLILETSGALLMYVEAKYFFSIHKEKAYAGAQRHTLYSYFDSPSPSSAPHNNALKMSSLERSQSEPMATTARLR